MRIDLRLELGDDNALCRGGQVLVVDEWPVLVCFSGAHGDLLVALGKTSIAPGSHAASVSRATSLSIATRR